MAESVRVFPPEKKFVPELLHFLSVARKNTYANRRPPQELPDGFKRYEFTTGKFFYRDHYRTSDSSDAGFSGWETVRDSKTGPIFFMYTYGGGANRGRIKAWSRDSLRKASRVFV